jgi:probable H4MPT-linked C1 transfer pathway protein
MKAVLGLDIGGANLKAGHTNGTALTRPFPLWRHRHRLGRRLRELIAAMPAHELLAVTMTGELCDCFASKADGVQAILYAVQESARTPILVWTLQARFAPPAEVFTQPLMAAAANWLALAHLAGRQCSATSALLIDVGSTTTDIVPLVHGVPQPRGWTDRERLAAGELVYTGVRRTPVCAVLGMEVAAEFFATMLDVHVVLGLRPEDAADCQTADGRPVTRRHAHARLARLLCADAAEVSESMVCELAQRALGRQVEYIGWAVDRVLSDFPRPQEVLLSGSGAELAWQVCACHPRLESVRRRALAEHSGVSEAAAAYAVAVLAQEALR